MPAEQLQAEAAVGELAPDALSFRPVREGVEQLGKAGNLASKLDFRGKAAGVLEDLERHAELGRDGLVLFEVDPAATVR